MEPTCIYLLAVLQDLDRQQEGEHELVSLKEAAADVDEESIREGRVEGSAALLHRFSLSRSSTHGHMKGDKSIMK